MFKSQGYGIVRVGFLYLNHPLKTCSLNYIPRHVISSNVSADLSTLRTAIKRGNISQVQSTYNALKACPDQSKDLFNRDILRKMLMTVRNGKRKDDINFILQVFNDMRSRYPLTHFEYHALMYAYGVQGQSEKAYDLLDRMQKVDNLTPNLHSYNILLGCYKRSNHLDKAEQLFKEMKQQPHLQLDIVTYNTLFHFYLKNEKFDRLFDMYEQLKRDSIQPDVYTYSTLLDAIIKSKTHQKLGLTIYHTLLAWKKHIDMHTINTMIRFIADIDMNQALDLYHDIEVKYPYLQPDTVTFNILLDLCLKNDNPSKAYLLFKDMKKLKLKPDVITYGTLIDAEAREGNLKASLELFQEMCDFSIQPNERILNSLVNIASSKQVTSRDLDRLLEITSKYQYTLQLDVRAYNALLYGLALQGRSSQAQYIYDTVFRDMRFRLPDIATFTHLLLAYINDNQLDEALQIYQTLREHHLKCKTAASVKVPIELDTTFYASLISSLSSSMGEDGMAAALMLFHDMRKLRIQPTKHIYTAMLHAAGQHRDDYVLEHVHQLIKVDLYLDPDIGIYNALMDAYNRLGDGDAVLEIWQTLTSGGGQVVPDQATVSIVMDSCGHNGQGQQAQWIWESLRRQGFALNTNNYNSYIECLCRQRGRAGWDVAYQLVKEEMSNGRGPKRDEKTVNTLLSFARKKGFDQSEIGQVEKLFAKK